MRKEGIVDYYENQRAFPIVGWSEKKLLPSDRWKFSSRDGKEERRREQLGPPFGYQWAENSEWHVEHQESLTDKDGWCYAFDFPFDYHPKMGRHDWVRRRRWVREVASTEETRRCAEGQQQQQQQEQQQQQQREAVDGGEQRKRNESEQKRQEQEAEREERERKEKEEEAAKLVISEREKLVQSVITSWSGHHGNRCGSLILTVERFKIPNTSAMSCAVIVGKRTVESEHPISTVGGHYDDIPLEATGASEKKALLLSDCFQCSLHIVDDQDPIRIVLSDPKTHQIAGEALLPLRRASVVAAKLVSGNGAYNEIASDVVLRLYPPANGYGPLRHSIIGSLGSVTVSYHFELEDTIGIGRQLLSLSNKNKGGGGGGWSSEQQQGGGGELKIADSGIMQFCDVCGKSSQRCKCDEAAAGSINANDDPKAQAEAEDRAYSSPMLANATVSLKAPSRKIGRLVFNVVQLAGFKHQSATNVYLRLCGFTIKDTAILSETAAIKPTTNTSTNSMDVVFNETLVLDVGDILNPLPEHQLPQALDECRKSHHGSLAHCMPSLGRRHALHVEVWDKRTFGSDKFLGGCGLPCPNEMFREAIDALLLEQQQQQQHEHTAQCMESDLSSPTGGGASANLLAYPAMMVTVPLTSRGDGVEDDKALLALEKANGGTVGYVVFNAMWIPFTL